MAFHTRMGLNDFISKSSANHGGSSWVHQSLLFWSGDGSLPRRPCRGMNIHLHPFTSYFDLPCCSSARLFTHIRHRFLFDLLLVSLMIFETWAMAIVYAVTGGGSNIASGASVLRVARIMRVLRTARMARLVRLMPELMRLGKDKVIKW